MNHQSFSSARTPDRQLPALFSQTLGGPPRFSVRALEAFDAPEALALAQETPKAADALRQLQHEARQRHGGPVPLPLLLLDTDAEPAMLLPLLLWRPAEQPGRLGLRGVATLAAPSGLADFLPPRRAGWQMTVLQARAVLRAVIARLPSGSDLLVCRAVSPLAAPDMQQLLADAGHAAPLPGCSAVHPLSWRGMLALLRTRALSGMARTPGA